MYTKYTGVILKKHPLGETDELLTIYTLEHGKLRAKAVSSRKIQSRMSGHLGTLNEIEFETAGTRTLPVIISVRARMVNSFLRENLKKFAIALVGAETLYRLTPDNQENKEAYQALRNFLTDLGKNEGKEKLLVRLFQLQLLKFLGFGFDTKGYQLEPFDRVQIESLWDGEPPQSPLSPRLEFAIDSFLDYVLEREIKSNKFLETLNQEVK